MKILNWNTKLCVQSQADVIECFIKEKKPDVILLQEVGSGSAISNYLDNLAIQDSSNWAVLTEPEGYGGKNYYVVFRKKHITSIPNSLTRFNPQMDPSSTKLYQWSDLLFGPVNGRSPVYADVEYKGRKYRIANWHAPIKRPTYGELSRNLSGGNNLEALLGVDSSLAFDPMRNARRTILAGDLNIHQSVLDFDWQYELAGSDDMDEDDDSDDYSYTAKKRKKVTKSPTRKSKSRGITKQKKMPVREKKEYMRNETLFHDYTSISPTYTKSLEHILFSFDSAFDLHIMSPGETQTINAEDVTNLSDHTLMFVKLTGA